MRQHGSRRQGRSSAGERMGTAGSGSVTGVGHAQVTVGTADGYGVEARPVAADDSRPRQPPRHSLPADLGTWDLGPGTWDLGPGTWDLGPGTWDLGPGTW